jgi:hypothetical protein
LAWVASALSNKSIEAATAAVSSIEVKNSMERIVLVIIRLV